MFPVVMRFAILMAVLSAIYMGLGWYMRWDRTRRLEDEFAGGEGGGLTREDYIAKGMADYARSWERKLLLGVFVLPILAALAVALIADYGQGG